MRQKLATFLLPVALVALGLGVRATARSALRAFTAYETPFAFPPALEPLPPARSPQVVVVLVDGLGLAPSRTMPFLAQLRAQGADYDCGIGLPSLSLPGRAVMLSGAWSEIHGQSTNFNVRPLRVEHLFGVARRAGLATALAAGRKAQTLFSPDVAEQVVLEEDHEDEPLEDYLARMRSHAAADIRALAGRPAFAYLELHAVDEAGHGWGAVSGEYARAVAEADGHLRAIAGTLDLARATLVVTGDHGHVEAGGHGGAEEPVMHVPLVLVGTGVRPGVRGTALQVDVATTLAALLGTAIPSANQGRPLMDALDMDASSRLGLLRRVVAQRQRWVTRYVARLRTIEPVQAAADLPRDAGLTAPPPSTEDEARRLLDGFDGTAARAAQSRLAAEGRWRLPRAALAGMGLFVLLVLLAGLSGADLRALGRAAIAAALGWLAYLAALPLVGIAYSLTAVNKDEWLEGFFRKDMVLGVGACALATLAAVWPLRSRPFQERCRMAWLVPAAYCLLLVEKLAFVYWRHGVFLRWSMPDQRSSFGFYLDALVVMAVGLLSPAFVLIGVAVSRPRTPSAAELKRAG